MKAPELPPSAAAGATEKAPPAADGVRWDDPAFGLAWLEPVTVIAPRDLAFPDWAGR